MSLARIHMIINLDCKLQLYDTSLIFFIFTKFVLFTCLTKLFQLSFEKTCSTTRSLFTRLKAECSALAETGNRRLLAALGPLFSLSLFISFKLSSAHLGSTRYEVFVRKCLMRDFVTYYCRW